MKVYQIVILIVLLLLLSSIFYRQFFKRFYDIVCALLAIIVFGWLYIIIAILVRKKLGSPVLFKQERPGMIDKKTGEEKIFTLYKFRSMTDEKDDNGNLLPDEVRLTKFGKLLRSTSLDELPEAFNILKGDMSVVGPRPLLVEYLSRYNKEQRKRHLVKPGLTGLAQINGRNTVTWEDKFKFDVLYVNKHSFCGDIIIVLKTIVMAIKREGISSGTCETMETFNGN